MKEAENPKEISAFKAALECKCPHCRSESMFLYPPYHPKFNKMHRHCPNCGGDLEPEPGFYFGAMYVSYGFNVAIMFTLFLVTSILIEPEELWVYFAIILTPTVLFLPLNFRWSRVIFLHLFGGSQYKSKASN